MLSSEDQTFLPYFSIDNARVIYTKRSNFVKNEHARYTAVYISLGCALYIRCALSIEKYGTLIKERQVGY